MNISQWIPLPTQSCLVLCSFCDNLLNSLIMWLLVSLSLHSRHLVFCCALSIIALIWLVLMGLFCAAIWRYSVSLLRFLFLSHIHVFSCDMLFISRLKCPGLYMYHLFIWLNFNFLHISQWITLPTLPCLVLFSFCVYLLHSLMW